MFNLNGDLVPSDFVWDTCARDITPSSPSYLPLISDLLLATSYLHVSDLSLATSYLHVCAQLLDLVVDDVINAVVRQQFRDGMVSD